ncbi:MAG: TMEM165/GDT1 family protein [Candidatus Saliniplasma sp.]
MNWIILLLFTFGIVALAEIGDKTQLMTISLASKYHVKPVFWGIFLGMGLITVVGVVVGTVLYSFIPPYYVKVLASLIFIFFGVYSLYQEETEDEEDFSSKKIFTTSFFLALVAEFGDKTQLVVIALTAQYEAPIVVLLGALAGLGLVIGIGVAFGSKLTEIVEKEKIELAASLLFIIVGVISLVNTLFWG